MPENFGRPLERRVPEPESEQPLRFVKFHIGQYHGKDDDSLSFLLFALSDQGKMYKWREGRKGNERTGEPPKKGRWQWMGDTVVTEEFEG